MHFAYQIFYCFFSLLQTSQKVCEFQNSVYFFVHILLYRSTPCTPIHLSTTLTINICSATQASRWNVNRQKQLNNSFFSLFFFFYGCHVRKGFLYKYFFLCFFNSFTASSIINIFSLQLLFYYNLYKHLCRFCMCFIFFSFFFEYIFLASCSADVTKWKTVAEH